MDTKTNIYNIEKFNNKDPISNKIDVDVVIEYISTIFEKTPINLANIGCGNAYFNTLLCKHLNIKKMVLVDPNSTNKKVIKMTAEKYLLEMKDNTYDLILFKYMFHYIKSDINMFIAEMRKKLTKNGKIIICATSKTTKFPWTDDIQKSSDELFENGVYNTLDFLYSNNKISKTIKAKIPKKKWIDFVESKTWGHMYNLTKIQIENFKTYVHNNYNSTVEFNYIISFYNIGRL